MEEVSVRSRPGPPNLINRLEPNYSHYRNWPVLEAKTPVQPLNGFTLDQRPLGT
jgi:hypothetical protein